MPPLQLTRFFGRDADIAGLVEAVEAARLVTVVGPPGSGKTRLAVEGAARMAAPGGASSPSSGPAPVEVAWVELAPVAPPMVVTALAMALGLAGDAGRRAEDVLVDAIAAGDPLLVVLDNCEHVLEPVAALVDRLLTSCPELRVLATSRAPLGLPGEQVWPVRPLDGAAAHALFVDRARLASSGDGIGPADDEAVEAICARVDRLPLAIELAAAWARTLSPEQIAVRLAGAPSLLAGPARGRPERHATMAATVDWSYRLLPADAQRLFEQLSVFVAGFDLEAAQAVAAPLAGDVLDALATLVDHSLVITDRAPPEHMRYRMLEPVRQWAEARLVAGGDHEAVRHRQAEHYLRLSREAERPTAGGTDPDFIRLMAREEHNVLAALEWARGQPTDLGLQLCVAMVAFWWNRGRVDEGRELLAERLAAGTPDPRLRVRGLVWAGQLAWRTGDYARAHQHLDEVLATTRETGDTWGTAYALCTRGQVLCAEGDAAGAVAACRESLALFREVGEELVWARMNLAWAHLVAGDVPAGEQEARAVLAAGGSGESSEGAPPLGDHIATALLTLQYAAFLRDDTAAQRAHLMGALAAMEGGSPLERSDWLACAAALACAEGRPHTGLRLLGGAVEVARRRGVRAPRAVAAPMVVRFLKAWDDVGRPLADRLYAQGATMTWEQFVTAIRAEPGDPGPLTPRESEVARLVAEGLANADIAQRLFLSRRTVEAHLDHIRRKLGFSNRHQIATWVLDESSS